MARDLPEKRQQLIMVEMDWGTQEDRGHREYQTIVEKESIWEG